MARRSFGKGELLLVVLRLLERRPMSEGEIVLEVDRSLGVEYRVRQRDVAVALDALLAERLVAVATPAGPAIYRVTEDGVESVSRRAQAKVLGRLDGAEIEEVAILFTDIVGSTELLDRLGDDAAHELRRRHFALLREAVRDHGGREVKSLGDGLMVAFAGAPTAVACAHAMQLAVSACEDPLELRIGIASGETVREDGDYFGRPVVVARRLCDAAAGGDVLVAGPAADELEPVGPLMLKGLSEPVAASAMRPRPLALSA